MKTCSKCKVAKSLCNFGKDAGSKDGLRSKCLTCAAKQTAEWREKNPEKSRKSNATWHLANARKVAKRNAIRYASNPEKAKEYSARYRLKNPERVAATHKAYRTSHPDIFRIKDQNRRARERGGKLSPDLALSLYISQEGKCACCGQPLGDTYHLDHIMPLALGGTNTDNNIQLLLPRCNRRKSAKHPDAWLTQIAKAGTVRASVTQTGHPE